MNVKIIKWSKLSPTAIVLLFFSLIALTYTLYNSRQIFFYQYEPEYYENYYYNSQWNVPQSTRGISDGELYKFVGYRLAFGENPFNINFETPPAGKYLYGLSTRYLGNPYYFSIFCYLALAVVIYLTSKIMFKQRDVALTSVLIYLVTPFTATQIQETMLDIPLTLFFSLYLLSLVNFYQRGKLLALLCSGVFLGLATGTKFGAYTPILILFSILIFIISKTSLKKILLFIPSVFTGYVLAYFCYFIKHQNPIPWFRLHEKAITFYFNGNGFHPNFVLLKGIFVNHYQGFWVGSVGGQLGDWSPLLPIGTILLIIGLFWTLRNKRWDILSLIVFSFGIFITNSFLDVFPRYLMPLIPAFAIIIPGFLNKRWRLSWIIILISLPFLINSFKYDRPGGNIEALTRFINTRAYRELYRTISPLTRNQIEEPIFISKIESTLDTLRVNTVDSRISNEEKQRDGSFSYDLNINYQTDFGYTVASSKIIYRKIHNQWRLQNWNWEYLLPGLTANAHLEITPGTTNLSNLYNKQGQLIAVPGDWYLVCIIPRLMYDWNKSINEISRLTFINSHEINNILRKSIPDDFVRCIWPLRTDVEPTSALSSSLNSIRLKNYQYLVPINKYKNKQDVAEQIAGHYSLNIESFNQGGKVSIVYPDNSFKKVIFNLPIKNLNPL